MYTEVRKVTMIPENVYVVVYIHTIYNDVSNCMEIVAEKLVQIGSTKKKQKKEKKGKVKMC
jgi:hypothetical protein